MLEGLTQQVQSLLPAVSFVGSAASVGVTGYFWLVRVNRERPRLQIEEVDHLSHIDLGDCTDGLRWLNFRLGLVVVNESSLPTAVLAVGARVATRPMGTWRELDGVRPARGSVFPLNLPPLQSGLLTLEWETTFPVRDDIEGLEAPDRVIDAYLREHWATPDRVTVEIRGVRARAFAAEVPLRGTRMASSVRGYLEAQRAAA